MSIDATIESSRNDERQVLRTLVAAAGFDEGEPPVALDAESVQRALVEGMGPLLGHRLRRGEIEVRDTDAAARLEHAHRSCTARNVLVQSALEPVMAALERRGIDAVVLKGAALIETVFRHPGCRAMGDVDLLVDRAAWREALVALEEAGARAFGDRSRRLTMRLYHEVHAALPDGGVLDLHRSLSPWPLFGVRHDELFRRAAATRWGALLPEPNDLFVSLAMHAAQDGFYVPFRAVVDGLALARTHGIDGPTVAARAEAWSARRAAAIWLHRLKPFGLPSSFDAALSRLDRRGRAARRARTMPADGSGPPTQRPWSTRWHLARSLDGIARPVAFFAYRGAVLVADVCMRALPDPSA